MFNKWNRKFHIYLGLYFLIFIWLFSFSGLLLNNPEWSISNYWPDREETFFQEEISRPDVSGDLATARDLMTQLNLRGEIRETRWEEGNDEFSTRIHRPGQILSVRADFAAGLAEVEEIRINEWGIVRMLHTFTGISDQSTENRNWLLTRIWSFSMDAVAVGLMILVFSGIYMWYRLKRNRLPGLVALGAGTFCCWFFLFGLALLF